ncbi:ADP-ribosylation factor-like protein 15 isoform X1 [Hippocampus zosterae]|uniref:ADP-ribosylation factor-like protein 15 isoform X1 n=1 Tax=Hippocampus zosterae TaxID=109293 RepID=UPI00223CA2FC|nr:ADP-ribosylation factor-like protein 15 isoform X1 [Hippocampus zosterae]
MTFKLNKSKSWFCTLPFPIPFSRCWCYSGGRRLNCLAPLTSAATPKVFPSANTCFRALCCKGPPPPRPEYDVVCIGLTGAGKTSLLSRLCSEGGNGIVPTTGFSIKAVPFPNAILNVKELGGADNIKKYWCRYYQGSQGVVFVLDSASSDEDLEAARNELHSALQHPQLCTLPFLILANHQDKPAARTPNQVKKYFELEPLARGKRWILEGSSTDDVDAVKESFAQFISLLEDKDMEGARI